MKTQKTYGLWPSVFSPKILSSALGLEEPQWDAVGTQLVWLEQQNGQGRLVGIDASGDCAKELTFGQNVRGRVGYGGGNFSLRNNILVFVGNDGKLYRQDLHHGVTVALTQGFGQCAAPQISPNGRWVVYVYEWNGESGLALAPLDGKRWSQKLISGADFYMDPRWSPSGHQISWVSWNHPNMPWDGTTLQVAEVSEEGLAQATLGASESVAGGGAISVIQPEFSPCGKHLAYLSDETGWYNLYLYTLASQQTRAIAPQSAELGGPTWVFGMRWYDWMPDGKHLVAIKNEQGFSTLETLHIETQKTTPWRALKERYTHLESICISPQGEVALFAHRPDLPKRLLKVEKKGKIESVHILKRSGNEQISPENYSQPESLQAENEQGQTIYSLFYAPQNPDFESSGRPPLIVQIHGGPTSQSLPTLNRDVQYFTSRGYACLNLNYRGSSGYGRAYRELLKGQWGVADVEDAVFMASHLVQQQRVDPQCLVIKGGSAGGYTVLQALVRHPDFFCAGICSYGISNLFNLVQDTHKFEQHYTDSLIGVLPEASALFHERSPLFFAEQIQKPLLLFQGEEDTVVPKNQTEAIVAALRQRNIPHEYHLFLGEGHGWRKQETILQYYNAMEAFLKKYVIFAV